MPGEEFSADLLAQLDTNVHKRAQQSENCKKWGANDFDMLDLC